MDESEVPEVSVVVAAYNVQNYIERAVLSALDQKGVRLEVVVIDDASSDDTLNEVSRIHDPRVRILRQTINAGPSATRNKGIAAAMAPWIAILDGDDAFSPERLQRCLQRARERQADIVIDNLEVRREADGARYPMFRPQDWSKMKMLDLAAFIKGNKSFFGGASLGYVKPVFSAAFLRRHNLSYDPKIRIGEDYRLLAEALAFGAKCAIEPTAGYYYTARKGSISHRLSQSDIVRIRNGERKFLSHHKLAPAEKKAQKRRDSNIQKAYCFAILVEALKQKKFFAALEIAASHPNSALHLWRPVWARIERLFIRGIRREKFQGE